MKFLSWNVNGIRAAQRKGFSAFLKKAKPDIIGLQEIKISDTAREAAEFDFADYEEYWNPARRPGYSGTAVLARKQTSDLTPQKAVNGFGAAEFDQEGRAQTLEFAKFYFVNLYFPNANHELSRLAYKLKFNEAFLKYVKKLEKKKPLVICGDFNVAHREIDIARPKDNVGNAGFTPAERSWMDKFTRAGLVDTFRHFNKNKIQYTWWTYRFGARERNIGWRIDYFLLSSKLIKQVKSAYILDKVAGSDHCPVGLEIEL